MTSQAEAPPPPVTTDVRRFLFQALAWNVTLFGVLRLAWIDTHVVSSLIAFQKTLVVWYGVAEHKGILVNASCSGSDVMALCVGLTLAYPSAWPRRVLGALGGVGLILTLNTIRIASLYAAAPNQARIDLLHLYVWPVVLAVATATYVFVWMWWSERRLPIADRRWMRFALFTAGALAVYAASVPWVFASGGLASVMTWTVNATGTVLRLTGAQVRTVGNVLITGRGAFELTPECLYTPVTAFYIAGVSAWPTSRSRRAGYLALGLPLFFALGVARLLVLALPSFVAGSPVFLAHGFYQLVAGATAIIVTAHVAVDDEAGRGASRRTLAAVGAAAAAAIVLGSLWESALLSVASAAKLVVPDTMTALAAAGDQQGALALLPRFQVGLVVGLWMAVLPGRRVRRLATALTVVAVSQIALLAGLGASQAILDVRVHALLLRGWALAVPIAIALTWRGAQGTRSGDRTYHRFWHDVGEHFPDLGGAMSTRLYFEDEKRLIVEALGSLEGRTILKTDLWDESKNTRILQWAASQGARVFGIDVSEPIVRAARAAFVSPSRLRPAVSDVRQLPFPDKTFDAIYSMGTIEHFAESEASVVELARVLKPGGRLILGVPNRHDPFLRPLLVACLYRIGLYAYGYEKSYSRRSLRRMIEGAGLTVEMESGILFMPGWLRMWDLWCHTRMPRLSVASGLIVQPFAWLARRAPALRRHGYLLASVGEKREGISVGVQYVVDASGCDPDALRSLTRLQALFADVLDELQLGAAAPPVWHVFPGHGGITGMVLLTESHLTIHTFPESRAAAIDLYCCRRSVEWSWESRLTDSLGARKVRVRVLRRG